MCSEIYNQLVDILDCNRVLQNETMSRHTTFRVGGNADFFVMPNKIAEIKKTIQFCRDKEIPYYVIGNGSNLLVGDKGIRGVVIQIGKEFNDIEVRQNYITAMAGAMLSKVGHTALEASLTGFEFAAGIPGTVGGAIVMNAGAYGGEMKHIVKEVIVMDEEGNIRTLSNEELNFSYRKSVISEKKYLVLQVTFALKEGEKEAIRKTMDDLRERRMEKQPLEYPSAGSTFKRPEGYFAGKLIEDAGLRGFQIGGAGVSEKHCGFVINKGNATAADIQAVMRHVANEVETKFQVKLEAEVKRLGEF